MIWQDCRQKGSLFRSISRSNRYSTRWKNGNQVCDKNDKMYLLKRKKYLPKTLWGKQGTVWYLPWCHRPGRTLRSDGAGPSGRAPRRRAAAGRRLLLPRRPPLRQRQRPALAPGRRPPGHHPRPWPPRRPRCSASCCRSPASTAPATPSVHRRGRQRRQMRRRWRRRYYHPSDDGRRRRHDAATVVVPFTRKKSIRTCSIGFFPRALRTRIGVNVPGVMSFKRPVYGLSKIHRSDKIRFPTIIV